jgi:hypothetical protein
MKNWTDKAINWHQLPGIEVQRLIATWGKSPAEIAKYDKKQGFKNEPVVIPTPAKKAEAKAEKPAKTTVEKTATRQKHTGTDGEVKFVEHRNLYVGFYGGKVVVTKRTADACKEVLRTQFKLEM